MKPWDEAFWRGCVNRDDFEELEEKLWAETTADEFYFAPSNAYGEECIAITPAADFDRDEGWDQHLLIEHLLPDYIVPMSEGIYKSEQPIDATIAALRAKGFRESAEFDAYAANLGD